MLKRAFTLCLQGWQDPCTSPIFQCSRRTTFAQGFFERDQFEEVRQRLPAELQPVVTFAYCTGWRNAERDSHPAMAHVDWEGGIVRLDAGEAKNDEPT